MALRTPELSAELKTKWLDAQARYEKADTPQEHFAVGVEIREIRQEIRSAGFYWPYAYTKPTEWGGYCVECKQTDGSHEANCEAVL